MPPVQSMPTSRENSEPLDGKDTSTRAGAEKESPPSKQTNMQRNSPSELKIDGALEPSNTSSTNLERGSTLSDHDADVKKRKYELESCNVRATKKRGQLPVATAIHMKLRAAGDAGDKWWNDLQEKSGLCEEEALVVYGIVTKHLAKEEFPIPVGEGAKKEEYYQLAEKGWRLMKDYNALMKLHPKATTEQMCCNGVWTMR